MKQASEEIVPIFDMSSTVGRACGFEWQSLRPEGQSVWSNRANDTLQACSLSHVLHPFRLILVRVCASVCMAWYTVSQLEHELGHSDSSLSLDATVIVSAHLLQ